MKSESIKTYSYRVSQANKTELIVIMYDMAIEYLEDSLKEDYSRNIKLGKRVIDELSRALDMQYEISGELFKLYMTMSKYLVKAMASNDEELVRTVIRMLGTLRKSFYELSKQDDSGAVMQNTQQVYSGLTYSNQGNSNEFSNDPIANRGFRV